MMIVIVDAVEDVNLAFYWTKARTESTVGSCLSIVAVPSHDAGKARVHIVHHNYGGCHLKVSYRHASRQAVPSHDLTSTHNVRLHSSRSALKPCGALTLGP